MADDDLLNRLDKWGFPLFRPEEEDANRTLADVVRSGDPRLWEGFPVVMARAAEKGKFDFGKADALLEKPFDKTNFGLLVALSLALYNFFKLKFSWSESTKGKLSDQGLEQFRSYLNALKNDSDFHIGHKLFSSPRVKSAFRNYYQAAGRDVSGLLQAKGEMGLEFALSQVFSLKQKELFFKKLRHERLTKTEREYFSRTVRKKVFALANEDLHRLARQLLGEL